MQIIKVSNQKYKLGQLVPINEMLPEKSISEMLTNSFDKEGVKKDLTAFIMIVAAHYLSLNVKSRAITTEAGYKLISEFIITECKNLELQEIEHIFKKGVLGRYGEIYNDISIDTICGKNGWIEMYYKTDRKDRPEVVKIENENHFSGKEISKEQFYKNNPEFEKRSRIKDLAEKAKLRKANMSDIKEFYKLKGLTLNDLKDDIQALTQQYYQFTDEERNVFSYQEYERQWINSFIIQNQYKVKS